MIRDTRLPGCANVQLELTYLRAGVDPPWERPHRDGVDITEQPQLWTPYQRARRAEYVERVESYRADGLIGTDT